MQDQVLAYFAGERQAGMLAALIGALALTAAVVLFQPRWELRSLAVTLGLLGLLELTVGIGLVVRTGPQVSQLLGQLGADTVAFYAGESERMARVQRNFLVLEYAWTAMLAAATIVALTQRGRPALWGVALGLLLHASFFLVFDLIAERRGATYLDALTRPRT
jgi:hypothetical protein